VGSDPRAAAAACDERPHAERLRAAVLARRRPVA
jgi:hypothetical protein